MNQLIFSLLPFVLIIVAFVFKRRQNHQNEVGGDISLPKSLWLSYTIGTWFLIPLLFLNWELGDGLRIVLLFHLISFWARGVLELIMIYKWFNWSPIYGISHSAFHVITFSVLLKVFWPIEVSREIYFFLIFSFSLIVSVGFEVIFAILFYRIRGKEKHKIYFASNSDEWKFVNYLTSFAVIICYGLHFLHAFGIYELSL